MTQYPIRVIRARSLFMDMLRCMSGNTPLSVQVGAEMRTAREGAKVGLRELARRMKIPFSSLSRYETGERLPPPEIVTRFMLELGAQPEQVAALAELARHPEDGPWLAIGIPERERQIAALLEMERMAANIIVVSPLLIPGILQTGAYARAIMLAGDVPPSEIDVRVAVRVGRRDAIERADPAHLTAFIGEGALYANIGGPDVMDHQLRSLLAASSTPPVELRVIPMQCEWNPGLEGPFVLVGFADRDPVVQVENRRSALFFHLPEDVQAYSDAVDKIREIAMSPEDSSELIRKIINSRER